ncbi:MAG: class I SAM-dependent methyltransferase [Anaerolineae bacterium]|jgi:SAM-dependent methyltransferase
MGLRPESLWVGGYVDYEWRHLRPILEAYGIDIAGKRVLEFGANVGASAIIYAHLGADVQAVDVTADYVDLARANARRYGRDDIRFAHVPDTRRLPFDPESFDLINCNSVLEYVRPAHLKPVQRELDRVLKVGGIILVTGTSSRLWPREVHSGRWSVNYRPDFLTRRSSDTQPTRQSVWPWAVRAGFGAHYTNLDADDGGKAFLAARANMDPPQDTVAHHVIAGVARIVGLGPGLLMNNLSCVLRKAPA